MELPITLEAQLVGECNITAEVAVFGRERSPLVRARGDECLEPLIIGGWKMYKDSSRNLSYLPGVDKDRKHWWHKQQLMPGQEERWKPRGWQSQCLAQHTETNLADGTTALA